MIRAIALLAIGVVAVVPAIAQEQKPVAPQSVPRGMMQGGMMQNGQGGMMQGGMMQNGMMGMHVMAVTVTALDSKTGLVDATSSGMALKLHFPPASLASVKVGDKLSVHLSFTK